MPGKEKRLLARDDGTGVPLNGSIIEVASYYTVFTDVHVAAQDNPSPTAGLVTPNVRLRWEHDRPER